MSAVGGMGGVRNISGSAGLTEHCSGRTALLAILAFSVLGSCGISDAQAGDRSPKRTLYQQKVWEGADRQAEISAPLRTMSNFKEDYSLPEKATKQKFSWGPEGCTWRVRMYRKPGASAGVRFRRAMDLATALKRNRRIIFLMRPHSAARSVTLGLTDHDTSKRGVVLSDPLSTYQVGVDRDWGIYSIELSSFPVGHPRHRINWRKVSGVRVVRYHGTQLLEELTFKNLLFEM